MEESGWKLVHGDVFRPPQYPMILSSLLGSGIQLFCMILIVICKWHVWLGVDVMSRGTVLQTATFISAHISLGEVTRLLPFCRVD